MEPTQFISLLVAIVGAAAYVIREMRGIGNSLREDSRKQSQRSDKLYEMFIDLVREIKK